MILVLETIIKFNSNCLRLFELNPNALPILQSKCNKIKTTVVNTA